MIERVIGTAVKIDEKIVQRTLRHAKAHFTKDRYI
jgi:hypothetical protein